MLLTVQRLNFITINKKGVLNIHYWLAFLLLGTILLLVVLGLVAAGWAFLRGSVRLLFFVSILAAYALASSFLLLLLGFLGMRGRSSHTHSTHQDK
jgi:hypothetical protein